MRVPQVSERIKEAPAQALRGVFAGIGQLLLITDKLRNKTPTYTPGPRPAADDSQPVPDTTASAPADQREEAAEPAPAEPLAAEPVPAEPVLAEPVLAEPVLAEAPKTPPQPRDFDKTGNVRLLDEEAGEVVAPLPNYGELSVASLRARLRNLDVTQVRELVDYERAHGARADVITMFERRIAKLETEA